jgi:hypothetical protein
LGNEFEVTGSCIRELEGSLKNDHENSERRQTIFRIATMIDKLQLTDELLGVIDLIKKK